MVGVVWMVLMVGMDCRVDKGGRADRGDRDCRDGWDGKD